MDQKQPAWVAILVLSFVAVAVFSNVQVLAQGASPFSGTWRLNLAKSRYMPGPNPKSGILNVEQVGNNRKSVVQTVAPDGSTDRSEYSAPIDGRDYPLKGSASADTLSLRQVNANTIERTDKRRGMIVMVHTIQLSPDRRTLTVHVKGVTGAGDHVDNLMVWDKQQ